MFPQIEHYPKNDAGRQHYLIDLESEFIKAEVENKRSWRWEEALSTKDFIDFVDAYEIFRPYQLTSIYSLRISIQITRFKININVPEYMR